MDKQTETPEEKALREWKAAAPFRTLLIWIFVGPLVAITAVAIIGGLISAFR